MSEDIKKENTEVKRTSKPETTPNKKSVVSSTLLKENGVYFGHRTRQWNPKMNKYIQFTKHGVHIINVDATQQHLSYAHMVASSIAKKGGKFLFVGTKNEAKVAIKENAIRTDSYYINERWLGGTLTNFRTVRNSVSRMMELERMAENNFDGYTKKEGIKLTKELEKLHKLLLGVKYMKRLPDAIFVASTYNEATAIKEAKKLGIPVFAMVDTNSDPEDVNFVIPSNDDASMSIALITTVIADAVAEANNKPTLVVGKSDTDAKPLGIIKKQPRPNNGNNNYNNRRPNRYDVKRPTRNDLEKEKTSTKEVKTGETK